MKKFFILTCQMLSAVFTLGLNAKEFANWDVVDLDNSLAYNERTNSI